MSADPDPLITTLGGMHDHKPLIASRRTAGNGVVAGGVAAGAGLGGCVP